MLGVGGRWTLFHFQQTFPQAHLFVASQRGWNMGRIELTDNKARASISSAYHQCIPMQMSLEFDILFVKGQYLITL